MKNYVAILFCIFCHIAVFPQYYLRGSVTDNHGDKLQYVKIKTKISNQVYRTDIYGGFGFSSPLLIDTLFFSYDGYISLTMPVKATGFATVILTAFPSFAIPKKKLPSSIIKNKNNKSINWTIDEETYNSVIENPFLYTDQSSSIFFSANSNRASYSNVRRLINDMDGLVPPDAVRIEEMLNYFNFQYAEPLKDSVFNISTFTSSCPWDSTRQLFFFNASARKINMQNIPASNLVFLIDASGSMDMPNKLPLIKAGFRLMIKNLRAIDTVSIVVYGDVINVLIDGIPGSDKKTILSAIDNLSADGPTPGESGIRLAYKIAQKHFIKRGNNRIFLAADGDFNVGVSTEKELEKLIEFQKKSGVYLTCLGVGVGNYKDSKLSILAQRGNGNFAYIDNELEAEKVLVTELTQTLFTVADNVFISTSFDTALVRASRLIGYDNEITNLIDTSKTLEGGDIGSGNSIMAIFELIPNIENATTVTNIAEIKLSYRLPGQNNENEIVNKCPYQPIPFKNIANNLKKATCVAMFGMKLKDSKYASAISWKKIQTLGNSYFSKNNFIEAEFLSLVSKAKKIYTHRRKYR